MLDLSSTFQASATCLCWECAIVAMKLFLGLFSKGHWQTWVFQPFHWGGVKPFESGKPISRLDVGHRWSTIPRYCFPSPGMDFKIHGVNAGWLPLRLWPPSWEHWQDRVGGQSLLCGELRAPTQESHVCKADLIFRIIWIIPRHRTGYRQWFLTVKPTLQSLGLADAREIN